MTYHKVNILSFVLYILIVTGLMIWQGIGITPDRYVLLLVLASLFVRKTRQFLLDWMPFLLILLSYDFLRGIADNLDPNVHYLELINIDKLLFAGTLPTVFLQAHFYNPAYLQWYDYLAALLYFVHFALPLGFGYILWIRNRGYFKQFTASILYLSYTAFFTYLIYPASPPWLSAKNGYIDGVTKILDVALRSFPDRLHLPTIYWKFDPNMVAAVPSLHAAYPLLVFLFGLKFFGRQVWWTFGYVLAVWLSIVYLGEHYVVDVLLGAAYAVVFFFFPPVALKLRHLLWAKGKLIFRKPIWSDV